MVATTGSVDFVLGNTSTKQNEMDPSEWAQIVRTCIAEMPLSTMRGFNSLAAFVGSGSRTFDAHMMTSFLQDALVAEGLPLSAVFVEICNITDSMPTTWENAPRKDVPVSLKAQAKLQTSRLLDVERTKLLLNRKGQLYAFQVRWAPYTEWGEDDGTASSLRPKRFGYNATHAKITLVQEPIGLGELLKTARDRDFMITYTVLHRLANLVDETLEAVRLQIGELYETRTKIWDRIQRINCAR